ncbi:MAG: hypothetical protein AAFX99_31145 [Myxococcota bacterium]
MDGALLSGELCNARVHTAKIYRQGDALIEIGIAKLDDTSVMLAREVARDGSSTIKSPISGADVVYGDREHGWVSYSKANGGSVLRSDGWATNAPKRRHTPLAVRRTKQGLWLLELSQPDKEGLREMLVTMASAAEKVSSTATPLELGEVRAFWSIQGGAVAVGWDRETGKLIASRHAPDAEPDVATLSPPDSHKGAGGQVCRSGRSVWAVDSDGWVALSQDNTSTWTTLMPPSGLELKDVDCSQQRMLAVGVQGNRAWIVSCNTSSCEEPRQLANVKYLNAAVRVDQGGRDLVLMNIIEPKLCMNGCAALVGVPPKGPAHLMKLFVPAPDVRAANINQTWFVLEPSDADLSDGL